MKRKIFKKYYIIIHKIHDTMLRSYSLGYKYKACSIFFQKAVIKAKEELTKIN